MSRQLINRLLPAAQAAKLSLVALLGVFGLAACEHMPGSAGNVAKTQVVTLGEVAQLQIESRRVACQSTVPMQCIQATDMKTQRQFLIWYNGVDGFNHTNGFRYVINAQPVTSKPMTDPSAQQWRLVDIVSQTPGS